MSSISSVFGYILNFIYELVQNYGVAIIVFSILLKLLLLPISIKQQKTMKKTSKLQGKIKEIQDKYKNNPEQMNKETMDLYKRENMSPFSGCLTSILQIVIILAMFYLVRSPLTFMKKVNSEELEACKTQIKQEVGEEAVSVTYPEISVLKYVSNILREGDLDKEKQVDSKNETEEVEEAEEEQKSEKSAENVASSAENNMVEEEIVSEKEINYNDFYINMDFLGLDLSNIPKENYKEATVYIIPVLYVITSIISMKLTTKMADSKKKSDNGDNEKGESPEDMALQMNKSMSLFLPVMSVMISLMAPLGLALYWLVNNILMIIERVFINKILDDKEAEQHE